MLFWEPLVASIFGFATLGYEIRNTIKVQIITQTIRRDPQSNLKTKKELMDFKQFQCQTQWPTENTLEWLRVI